MRAGDAAILKTGLAMLVENKSASKLLLAAIAVYLLFSFSLLLRKPGLQYDEALHVMGAVHMRHSAQELTVPHDPDTWACAFGRCLPVMTVRYVGALKEYLCLPLFALFGPKTSLVRLVSILATVIGLLGIAKFLSAHAHPWAGAATVMILAVNPTFVNMTLFENSTIGMWTMALGLAAFALSRYLNDSSYGNAFLLGLAAGFGVWMRANFVWMLAAAGIAAFVQVRWRLFQQPKRLAVMAGGALTGALPFILYQVISGGGTWEAAGMFESQEPIGQRLYGRWVLFSESLLADREHRVMWGGSVMPAWQRWAMPIVVWAAVLVCLARGSRMARMVAIAFAVLFAFLFSSRLQVSEHHLMVTMPFAAAAAFLAAQAVRWLRWPAVIAAAIYAISALQWHALALQGLSRTGGIGVWSDGIDTLAGELGRRFPGQEIQILDWGLQNSLYVVTDGKLRTREIYGYFPADPERQRTYWTQILPYGGVFALYAPENRQMPATSNSFLQAIQSMGARFEQFAIPHRDGSPYAEIYSVRPGTLSPGTQSRRQIPLNDPESAQRFQGFHAAEQSGWRWTARTFSIRLNSPALMTLHLYVPEPVISRFGSITLKASADSQELKPETYRKAGAAIYQRQINKAGESQVNFALSNALPPTPADARELGVIVSSVEIAEIR